MAQLSGSFSNLISEDQFFGTFNVSNYLSSSTTTSQSLSSIGAITTQAAGDEILVSTTAELMDALNAATGGETILLTAGNYADLNINGLDFATDVTIKSQDPLQAVFGTISVQNSSHIVFDAIHVEHIRTAGEYDWTPAFSISGSNNISILNSELNGSPDNDHSNDIRPLDIFQSQFITISNNNIHDGVRGAMFNEVDNLTITNNLVHDIRTDGFDFVAVRDVVITGNTFTDFKPIAGDHADGIQFWSVNAPYDSSDVVIGGNTFLQGSGSEYQSIFINDAITTYARFTIEDNVIYNGGWHGITIYKATDVVISNNTVVPFPDSLHPPHIWVLDPISGITVENNIAYGYNLDGFVGATFNNNLTVTHTDSSAWDYTGAVLLDGLAGADATRDSLQTVAGQSPDGSIDFSTIGATTFSGEAYVPPEPDTSPVDYSSVFASLLASAVDRAATTGDSIGAMSAGEFTPLSQSLTPDAPSGPRFDFDDHEIDLLRGFDQFDLFFNMQ